jgi:hypothetical protein
MYDMFRQPRDEDDQKGDAEAPIGNPIERVEIGRLHVTS